MPLTKDDANIISSIAMTDQASTPDTPASGKSRIFTKADGLYWVDDAGTVVGPMGEAGLTNPMTTAGDVIFGGASGTPTRLAIGTAAQVLKVNAGATAPEWGAAASGGADYINIQDQKSNNTVGGTFTAGAWRTRVLNTEQSDTGGHASIASNQITLAAGTYIVQASAPGYFVGFHKARLYNITAGAVTIDGTSESSYTDGGSICSRSFISGKFTIAGSTVFEVQHYCNIGATNIGFGPATNFGVTEVFTIIELWKVA